MKIRIVTILGCALILSGCTIFKKENAPVKKVFKVTGTEFYGSLWSNKVFNKYHVIAQDGGDEFEVPGGSIWTFGDTFKGTKDNSGKPHHKGGAVNTSIAFLPKGSKPYPLELQYFTEKDGTAAYPFSYLDNENNDKNSIWPLAGIYLNGKYYLYYTMIEKTGNGSWDFEHVGSGLAVSDKPLAPYTRIVKNNSWHFPVKPSGLIQKDSWIYLYSVDNTSGFVQGVFLSRVKMDNIENSDAYEYFAGYDPAQKPVFSKNKADKKVMLDEIYGQTSIVWNKYLGKYILVASSSFRESRTIKFYTSNTPMGPWYNNSTDITIPEICQDKKVTLVYCTFFHPSLFEQNGKVMYLTYSLHLENSWFDATCEMARLDLEKVF